MDSLRPVRILISSPGDVAEERDRARQVIEGLRRRYADSLILQPVLWENLPLQADMAFQQGIDLVLSKDSGVDIAVFILWSRLGSPLGARILKDDGTEYRSGTEREFDLMMQARRLSGGNQPAILAYVRQDRASFEERLRGKPTTELEELIGQKKLVEQFVQEVFHDTGSGHNVAAYHTFDRPVSFSQRMRTHLIALLDELAGDQNHTTWDIDTQGPPFLGLQSFQPQHAEIFFGREQETQEARFALGEQAKRGCAFLLLTGASGSGKSSLARAGVLPEIVQNEKDDQVAAWKWLIVTPAELAPDPVLGLVMRLAQPDLLADLNASAAKVAEGITRDPELTVDFVLRPAFQRLAAPAGGQVRLLLVIDQFEEIFAAHVMTSDDRQTFLKVIEALARSGLVWVLASARSDFYHQIQDEPVLARLLKGCGPLAVLPPEPDALQRLIEEPARLAGLRFEQDEAGVSLAGRILTDASTHAEMLPLVEFVLRELFDQRSADGVLLKSVYEKLGGVEGAVGQKAEETFQSLPPAVQDTFEEVLPLLVAAQSDGRESAIRRWSVLADLQSTAERKQLIEALVAGRFLTTDDQGNTPVAGFSHEALLRCWSRITQWVAANREFLRMRSRVEQQEQRWSQQGGDLSLLLPPGLPLEEGRTLLTGARHVLSEPLAGFIQQSLDHAQTQEQKARRRRRAVLTVMSCLTCVALAGGLLAWVKQNQALKAQRRSQIAEDEARNQAEVAQEREHMAVESDRFSKQLIYDIRMKQVQDYWDKWNGTLFYEALNEQLPEHNDGTDRRGFEWYYWQRRDTQGLTTFRGHGDVMGVSFSPDGTRLASASNHGKPIVWDVATGRETLTLRGHESFVYSVVFSPDGARIASVSNDRTVRVWDAATGREILTLRGHENSVKSVAFSPDGTRIASASSDNTVKLWDAATGRETLTLRGHLYGVQSVAFSPDGTRIASASSDNTVNLWDAASGTKMLTLRGHERGVNCVALSPDGTRIASASFDNTVRVWDAATGREILTLRGHNEWVQGVSFSPDGTRIASASQDNTVRLWDAATGRETLTLRGHAGPVWGVGFSPDGTRIASGSWDGTVKLWDAAMDRETLTLRGHENPVKSVAFSPNGTRIASASFDNTVRVWDAATGRETLTLRGHKSFVRGVAYSPDGTRIASASEDKTVKLWDAASGRETLTLRGHEGAVRGVAFSPDGTRIASASDDKTVKLWDAATGRETLTIMGHEGWVLGVAFSPDGTRIASASFDKTVKLWDAASGRETGTLRGHEGEVFGVAFSPDGTRIASTSYDKTVRLWDLATGREIFMLRGHQAGGSGVAFSPDGTRITSASDDKTVKLWDAATGRETLTLKGHESYVAGVAFSPDGTRITSASDDNTVKLWDASPATPESRAREEATNLVLHLLDRVASEDELRKRISTNRTISDATRTTALELAGDDWAAFVLDRFIKNLSAHPGDIALWHQLLEDDASLSPEIRKAALERVRSSSRFVNLPNNTAWEIVRTPGRPLAEIRRAVGLATVACRLVPDYGMFIKTLGVAQYRAGLYVEALVTLQRYQKLKKKWELPLDLAFLAMTHQQLGQHNQAAALLKQLRELLTQEINGNLEEARGFLSEAEALIELDPVFPVNPFAR